MGNSDRNAIICRPRSGWLAVSCLIATALVSGPVLRARDAAATLKLGELLDLTGKSVEVFWEHFSAVTCTELVKQIKLAKPEKIIYQRDSSYDYLIFLDLQGTDLLVEESRLVQKQSVNSKKLPLLITGGFSTLALIFHPFYQGSFEYGLMEDDIVNGKRLRRISYRHVHGTRSTSALRLRGRDYPLDLQGTAWIDPDSAAIARITAELMSPMDDLNLRVMKTEVQYECIRFDAIPEPHWLPTVATIDVETARQRWRNVHRFTNYRHFSVKSESVVSK